jgi:hypothetical protein
MMVGIVQVGYPLPKRFWIETGRWYDVKVESSRDTIRTCLDGKLIQTGVRVRPVQLLPNPCSAAS